MTTTEQALTPEPGRPVRRVDLRDPSEADLARRIASSWRELRRGARDAALRDHIFGMGDDALDQGQLDTLDLLVTRPEWRMSELADALRVDPSTATRAVQRLVSTELAERRNSGDDGRVVCVAVSRLGAKRHAEVSKRRARFLSELLGTFEAPQRAALADLLERFVAGIDRLALSHGDGGSICPPTPRSVPSTSARTTAASPTSGPTPASVAHRG